MIVVDTTVLVYAVGDGHLLSDPCRELVRRVGDARIRATTTVEVLQEFAHVRARRRGRADAAELTRTYRRLFAPLLPCDGEDLEAGLELFGHHDALGAFDAGGPDSPQLEAFPQGRDPGTVLYSSGS